MSVYPLRFEPILMPRIWGGQRLADQLGKRLPPNEHIGESWELVDLDEHGSVVAWGPAKGKTLRELVREWGADLIGWARLVDGGFPLLIKFLDARATLSLQVHPSESIASARGGRARIKHEAWYVIDAKPDSMIYRGLKEGVDAADLRAAVAAGRIDDVIERIPAKKGHAYYLPSGTVHALGGGVLVAEVQTPSDTTYRLYDWDRVDAAGKPRQLHIEDAIACLSPTLVPKEAEKPQHVASVWTSITSLVRCESFVIERVRMVAGVEQAIPYDEMMIWIVLEGAGRLFCKGLNEPLPFGAGDTILLPAALKEGRVRADDNCMWLEVSVPVESSLSGFERPSREAFQQAPGGGLVSLNLPKKGEDETGKPD